jgi:hypothetical protein
MLFPGAPLTGLFVLALALAAPAARAQEGQGMELDLTDSAPKREGQGKMELDLTESAPKQGPSGEFSMDLTSELTKAELLPRVVLLGLDMPQRSGTAIATKWLKRLYAAIRTNELWVLSAPPKEVREKLGGGYAAALRCQESSCLAESADTLEADMLVTARLTLEDKGWTLRLWTYDPDHGRVEMDVLTGRSPRELKFQKAGAKLLARRIKGMARPRSILKVYVNVPQAVVRLGERTLGVGSIEARVAPGEANLTVDADEYSSFTKTISLTPGERNSVEVYLEASGPAPDSPSDIEVARRGASLPAIFGRPALYTAVAGMLAVGAGFMVRQQAREIASRAEDADGDGIADITRRERLDGRNKTNLSTALVAGGTAVAGGSALWIFLMPVQGEAPRAAPGVASGGASGSSTALHLFLGGSF